MPSTFDEVVDIMAHERCDLCGAGAFVLTAHDVDGQFLPLSWCAHHFAKAAPTMTAPTAMIAYDIREVLTARESLGHP